MAAPPTQPLQIRVDTSTSEPCVQLGGSLTIEDVDPLLKGLMASLPGLTDLEAVDLDLSLLQKVDGAGVAALLDSIAKWDTSGISVRFRGVDASLQRVLNLYSDRLAGKGSPRPAQPEGVFHRIGLFAVQSMTGIRDAFDFLGHCAVALPGILTHPRTFPWRDLPLLLQRVGGGGLGIVALTNLLIGMIVAFVGVLQLQRFGAQHFVTDMIAIGHIRELGPLITAIIISGRTGAGFAAELGTMKVSEEVDALRSMGFDPFRWLVLPRLTTLLIALPLLTLVGDYVGILGGMIASLPMLDMNMDAYLEATARAITMKQFLLGWIKTIPFAVAIALLSCAQGLATSGGAEAVGERTTRAVVLSIFAVILLDSMHAMVYAMLQI